jgi:hypothetical protein
LLPELRDALDFGCSGYLAGRPDHGNPLQAVCEDSFRRFRMRTRL